MILFPSPRQIRIITIKKSNKSYVHVLVNHFIIKFYVLIKKSLARLMVNICMLISGHKNINATRNWGTFKSIFQKTNLHFKCTLIFNVFLLICYFFYYYYFAYLYLIIMKRKWEEILISSSVVYNEMHIFHW